MVDHRKRLITNTVFLLSTLSVVDGCSYFYSAALALENPAGILDSSGHIETQWICLQGKTKAHCSKESTGPTVSSWVGEPNRLHAKKLSRLQIDTFICMYELALGTISVCTQIHTFVYSAEPQRRRSFAFLSIWSKYDSSAKIPWHCTLEHRILQLQRAF